VLADMLMLVVLLEEVCMCVGSGNVVREIPGEVVEKDGGKCGVRASYTLRNRSLKER
jgi:hypothetical protein